jgi:hypothetical protein
MSDHKYSMVEEVTKHALEAQGHLRGLAGAPSVCQ